MDKLPLWLLLGIPDELFEQLDDEKLFADGVSSVELRALDLEPDLSSPLLAPPVDERNDKLTPESVEQRSSDDCKLW